MEFGRLHHISIEQEGEWWGDEIKYKKHFKKQSRGEHHLQARPRRPRRSAAARLFFCFFFCCKNGSAGEAPARAEGRTGGFKSRSLKLWMKVQMLQKQTNKKNQKHPR